MGYYQHDAVIATDMCAPGSPRFGGTPDPDIAGLRESMPEALRHLVIGPVSHAANGGVTYVFLPDGSKEGWDTSDAADEWRERFIDRFRWTYSDGSSPFDVVHVTFGGDFGAEVGARIAWTNQEPS